MRYASSSAWATFVRAAVFHGARNITVEDVNDPRLDGDHVLVSPQRVGICGSDLHIFEGEWKINVPLILGHEVSGKVVDVGQNVNRDLIGSKIIVEPAMPCGKCYWCKSGSNNYFCESRPTIGFDRDGAMANFVKVPLRGIHKVSQELSYSEAAFVEPLACVIRGIDNAKPRAGESVLVLGSGPIGLMFTQLLSRSPISRIIVVDLDQRRLEMASKLGADDIVQSSDNVESEISRLTYGRGPDLVIEAIGSPATGELALKVVKRGGRIIFFGVHPMNARMQIDPFDAFYTKEVEIKGSFCSPLGTFPRAVHLIESGRAMVESLVSGEFPLTETARAFETLEDKRDGPIKVMIKPNE